MTHLDQGEERAPSYLAHEDRIGSLTQAHEKNARLVSVGLADRAKHLDERFRADFDVNRRIFVGVCRDDA
jgi:hypothetical protein